MKIQRKKRCTFHHGVIGPALHRIWYGAVATIWDVYWTEAQIASLSPLCLTAISPGSRCVPGFVCAVLIP